MLADSADDHLPVPHFDSLLTIFGEPWPVNGESLMAGLDSLNIVRARIGERIAEIEQRVARLKPVDICSRMEAIRAMAADHGLAALEGLADYAAHHALMPGHVAATRACLEHMDEALTSEDAAHDRESILAALAVRLH
jgi:ribonucleotide reductase alpha subunit